MKLNNKVICSFVAVFFLISCTYNVTYKESSDADQDEYQEADQKSKNIKTEDGKDGKSGFFKGGAGEDGESINIISPNQKEKSTSVKHGKDGKAGKNGFFRGGDGEPGESITISK